MSVRELNFARTAKRRAYEHADALDFLVYGDEGGRHAGRCVHAVDGGEPCSREYDPMPYFEAAPTPSSWYVGTGISALYGLGETELVAGLAGWNVRASA